MGKYAESTSVPVAKSRAEIEAVVVRYGATRFASMLEVGRALVMFEADGRRVCFALPLPDRSEFKLRKRYGKMVEAYPEEVESNWEQACRQKWRALALVIKAKLEAVESGITTFEDEFLAHIVMPNGKTVGGWLRPQLAAAYEHKTMPPMLMSGMES